MNYVRLGVIVEFLDNRRIPLKGSDRALMQGNIPYYGANGQIDSVNQYIFDEPLVLLAEDGGHFGSKTKSISYKIEGKSWVNNHAHVLRPKADVHVDYLHRALSFCDISRFTTGSTRVKLTKADAEKIKIPLPDLPTQIRIANELEKADIAIQKRRKALELTDQYLQSAFLDMFGDPVRNEKGWEVKSVDYTTNCIVPGRDKPKSFTGDIPWITTEDLIDKGFVYKSNKHLGLNLEEIKAVRARIIPKGSVLLTCVGDLGITSIVGNDLVVNQQLHSYQCNKSMNNFFLMYCLSFQKLFMYKMASSTTVPYMNKTICNSIPIIIPPLPLQQQFATLVEKTEKLREKQRQSEKELDNLFQSLMQKYFG